MRYNEINLSRIDIKTQHVHSLSVYSPSFDRRLVPSFGALTVSAFTPEPVGHSSAGQNLFPMCTGNIGIHVLSRRKECARFVRSSHFYEKEIIFIRTVSLHPVVHCLYRKNFVIEQFAGQFFRNKRFVSAEREQFFPHLRRLFFKRRFLGKFVFKGKRILFFVGFLRKQRAIVFFIGDLFRRR